MTDSKDLAELCNPRPTCLRCGEPWVPSEGEDAHAAVPGFPTEEE